MIATNAEPILKARLKGMRPEHMVAISMVGPLGLDNPTVFAKPEVKYDWRWVRGLDVCLYLEDSQDWPGIAKDIALQHPQHFSLWNHAEAWGATIYLIPQPSDLGKPVRYWKWELDFTPWLDFQNKDFAECRRYERNEWGFPYAVDC